MNWSIRQDKRFRLAIGSFVEDYSNKVRIHHVANYDYSSFKIVIHCRGVRQ